MTSNVDEGGEELSWCEALGVSNSLPTTRVVQGWWASFLGTSCCKELFACHEGGGLQRMPMSIVVVVNGSTSLRLG